MSYIGDRQQRAQSGLLEVATQEAALTNHGLSLTHRELRTPAIELC